MSLVCFEMQSNLKEKKCLLLLHLFFAQPFSSQNALGADQTTQRIRMEENLLKKTTQKKNNHPRPSNNILIFVATEIPSFRKTSLDFLFHFPCKVFIIIMSSCPQSLLESVLRARHHCCCCCCYARTRRRLFFGGGGAASTCVRTRRCPRRWSHDGSPCRCRWIPSANRSGPGGER